MSTTGRLPANPPRVLLRSTNNPEIAAVIELYPDEVVRPFGEALETKLSELEQRFAHFTTVNAILHSGGR